MKRFFHLEGRILHYSENLPCDVAAVEVFDNKYNRLEYKTYHAARGRSVLRKLLKKYEARRT